MEVNSETILWIQVLALILVTIVIVLQIINGIIKGTTLKDQRIFAVLWPQYLVIPSGIVYLIIHEGARVAGAEAYIIVPIIGAMAGWLHFELTPKKNWDYSPSPHEGFLALAAEDIPSGFQETEHRYSSIEYSINLQHEVYKSTRIRIIESFSCTYGFKTMPLLQEFMHMGVPGHVYGEHNAGTEKKSLALVWLNPPQQRIAIHLTHHQPEGSYSADDLIKILQAMKLVDEGISGKSARAKV